MKISCEKAIKRQERKQGSFVVQFAEKMQAMILSSASFGEYLVHNRYLVVRGRLKLGDEL